MLKHSLLTLVLAFGVQYALLAQLDENAPEIIITEVSDNPEYGFKPENPIKVGSIGNEYEYLSMLKGPNGEKVTYSRISSCCGFECKTCPFKMGLLDKWQVKYEGQKEPVVIYLNGYLYEQPLCINGFTCISLVDTPYVKPPSVSPCKKKLYAVESEALQELYGILPKPDIAPRYTEKDEKLVSYFMQNPLTDEDAEQMVFKVEIAFMVTCTGETGNYKIANRLRGKTKTLALKILVLVSKLPGKWEPATKGKKTVDSYQVLSFNVKGGKLYDVTHP